FLGLFGVKDIASGPFGKSRQLWTIYEDVKKEIPALSPKGFTRLLYDKALDLAPEKDIEDFQEEIMTIDNDSDALPRNIIFYGPPGTGKTYKTIDRSLLILDAAFYRAHESDRTALKKRFDELKEQKRIGFVTFHQSFSYEEFVEGLKADKDQNNQIIYRIDDGIFKTMCESASSKVTQRLDKNIDLSGKRIWKISLGNTLGDDSFIYDECIQNGYILIGYGGKLDYSPCKTREDIQALFKNVALPTDTEFAVTALHTFKDNIENGDIIIVTDGNHKFRAIGRVTGNYRVLMREDDESYTQCRDVEWLRVYSPSKPKEELIDKTFSQMALYELKPGTLNPKRLEDLLREGHPSDEKFTSGEEISSYTIEKVGAEVLGLRKKNGDSLSFDWAMLNVLAQMVTDGKITVEDIRQGRVFDKAEAQIDKYIVNGHRNVIAPIVERIAYGEKRPIVATTNTNARVLIIDEINRGNIAKIFGELITLIEENKRAGKGEALSVTLPYSKTSFSVPDNLYIIGTMNTADRSLTSIDAALRRRFAFREFYPEPHHLADLKSEDG
ncbi:MAG TPA: AAA family ATPase, partial [Alphaproteobacteria bacterium]|nr:AAA family ATPase [Alphaproteobacteria bacterium]